MQDWVFRLGYMNFNMLKFLFLCKMKRERFRKAMKLAKNGNIANWGGTHSYSHAGQVQSLTSTVNQILVTLISATSLLQCMMHNGVKVTFSPKQLIGQRIREGLYTNSLVYADSFYASFTNITFQKEPICMYLMQIPSLTYTYRSLAIITLCFYTFYPIF